MLKPRLTPIALVLGSLLTMQSVAAQAQIENANQQDDIIISASRVETKRIESGSSITVLDAQYIKDNQARTVAELLQDVPGVSVNSNGGLGQTTSVYIRGADSNKTLVIIDGIEVNDLSNIKGGYGFAHLMADNIERIEVLRGSQSALWGSDAMGGVINIITKKGSAGSTPSMAMEFGENDYNKSTVNLSGAQGNSHYSLSAHTLTTDGISATDTDPDDDGYKNENITLKGGHQFSDIFAMDAVLRYSDAEGEYDIGDYTSRHRQAKINSNLNLLNNRWKNRLSIAFSDSENENYGKSEGQKVKTDLQSDYYLNTVNDYSQRLSFIAEHENDNYQSWSMDEKQRIEASGLVFGYGADWQKTVFVNAAVRHDYNSKFDDTTTYHIDVSTWISDGTRLHASHGTGVKNPSLGQLYGYSPYEYVWDGVTYTGAYEGNSDLKPEKSLSWDAGIEYNFADIDGYIDLTYFDSRYTDMHDYVYFPTETYINLDNKATARGVELTTNLKVAEKLRVNVGYTFMETDDGEGDELVRRPKHAASINSNYQHSDKLSTNFGVRYVGKRLDISDVDLDDYIVVNIGASYKVHERITLSARLENAFDEDYEEVSGYNTDPATAYIGVTFK
ncbi:TonB-dependent receptor plug domain-containing protein [Psychromonas sp.]|uniref:TonB-dependent receptor plug domain-containing protein n=1 Tax=Psychromonas sp. TaxID=1884585 RepID=UPI00356A8733